MTHNDEIHILQFGTGNFLRAFVEPMVQDLQNNYKDLNICIIQSTSGSTLEKLKAQNFQYHVLEAGFKNGEKIQNLRKITCIKDGIDLPKDQGKFLQYAGKESVKWIISNVTEAGMTWKEEGGFEEFAESFAGRLTQWLFKRFSTIPDAETVVLPCELIPQNGELLFAFVLKHAELWNLGPKFLEWIKTKVFFFTTLVDRIVPGFPDHLDLKEKESDHLLVQTEPYSFWAIEGQKSQASLLPFIHSSSEVILQEDISAFSLRKIRILNGCHTYMAAKGIMLGYKTVLEFISNQENYETLNALVEEEIIPCLEIDRNQLQAYKNEVFDRFRNPFVEHKLEDIMLNGVAKFKSRLHPLMESCHIETKNYPVLISKGLIYLILFYLEQSDKVRDTAEVKRFFAGIPSRLHKKSKVKYVFENLFGLNWNEGMVALYKEVNQQLKPSNRSNQNQGQPQTSPLHK
jgi:tagaturonate reductase